MGRDTVPPMTTPAGAGHSVEIGNSLIQAELRPITLTIMSPNARIIEFCHNPNLQDPFFAKIYLPYTCLTGYRDGHVRTAEGRGYLCLHFNGNDPRVFGLASMHVPEPSHGHDSAISGPSAQPPSQAASTLSHTASTFRPIVQPTPQRSTGTSAATLSTHGPPIPQASTFHATFTTLTTTDDLPERPSRPPLSPDSSTSPTPALFFRDRSSGLTDPFLFGSTPAEQEDLSARDDSRQYTPSEWLFLTEIVRYFKGAEDLRRGLVIPDEFRLGEYLEGIGSEGQVSLRLPALEALFVRASRTWPTSIFKTFAPNLTAPTPALSLYDTRGNLEVQTPSSTVDDVDELSSTKSGCIHRHHLVCPVLNSPCSSSKTFKSNLQRTQPLPAPKSSESHHRPLHASTTPSKTTCHCRTSSSMPKAHWNQFRSSMSFRIPLRLPGRPCLSRTPKTTWKSSHRMPLVMSSTTIAASLTTP